MESAVEIDDDRLKQFIQAAQSEFPDVDPYFIYVFAVDHLMREQDIVPDKDVVEEMIEKSKQCDFSVHIKTPKYIDHDDTCDSDDDSDNDSDDDEEKKYLT